MPLLAVRPTVLSAISVAPTLDRVLTKKHEGDPASHGRAKDCRRFPVARSN